MFVEEIIIKRMAINGRCRTYVNRYRNVAKENDDEGERKNPTTTNYGSNSSSKQASNSSNSDGGRI